MSSFASQNEQSLPSAFPGLENYEIKLIQENSKYLDKGKDREVEPRYQKERNYKLENSRKDCVPDVEYIKSEYSLLNTETSSESSERSLRPHSLKTQNLTF